MSSQDSEDNIDHSEMSSQDSKYNSEISSSQGIVSNTILSRDSEDNTIDHAEMSPQDSEYNSSPQDNEDDTDHLEFFVKNFTNWTSGNKQIDDFIQTMQLYIYKYTDIVFEWIPYNQFSEIIETGKNSFMTVYLAKWKDGPLVHMESKWKKEYKRNSNEKVALTCFHSIQNPIETLINEFYRIYGISQNPDTSDYILIQNNSMNLINCISGNRQIDDFIQEMQLNSNEYKNLIFEWIPYNQFSKFKRIGKNSFITAYSAIWKDGPYYKHIEVRCSNKEVVLKCLHNSENPIKSLINEVKDSKKKFNSIPFKIYGISQNPDTNDYILVQNNILWESENKKIDDFIHKIQSIMSDEMVFEWIPYNQFSEIKETGKNGFMTVYSAIWKNGPFYEYFMETRHSNKSVALKCLYCLQYPIEFIINEVEKKILKFKIYGISQNPNTNNYILVCNNFMNLMNWKSGNKQIDYFIREMQLSMNECEGCVFEWIPYNQFEEVKVTGKNRSMIVYSAIWKNGPLSYNYEYTRYSNKIIALKCLYNTQNSIKSLINEIKKHLKNKFCCQLYGISKDPNTNNYILVLNDFINLINWMSGNEQIDYFIQEMQFNMNKYDVDFEWIPYDQFKEIKETDRKGFITEYLAIWKKGPLYYDLNYRNYKRDLYKEVSLKYLHNSQYLIEFLLEETSAYLTNYTNKYVNHLKLYGISQDPNTHDYILVQNNFINFINWTSGNEKIDHFIQEMQLKVNNYNDTVFEWIPFNRLYEIKKTAQNSFIRVYSAIWKDGPLYKENMWDKKYTRDSNKNVALKDLHISQNSIEYLINEVKNYSIKSLGRKIYGISKNPDTNNYILVQNDFINLINWMSGNEKIDYLIQEMQLNMDGHEGIVFEWIPYNQFREIKETEKNGKPDMRVTLECFDNSQNSIESLIDEEMQLKNKDYRDIIFKWIPYNQFSEIKETGKNDFMAVYSAIWKDGPLCYNYIYKSYRREPNKEIALKRLYNSQNPVEYLINEVKKHSTEKIGYELFKIYGISKNPDTNDYVLVQNDFINLINWMSGNEKIDYFIKEMQLNTNEYENTVFEWIPYNQFCKIKETGRNCFMTTYSSIWKDGPLHKKYGWDRKYTRNLNKEVILKCLHISQNPIESLINEVKIHSTKKFGCKLFKIYGISQNPSTTDYILVQNNIIWSSEIKEIDDFVQEMQLNTKYENTVFEWIPYNQFSEIKEAGKCSSITIYSAIWKDGPLYYSYDYRNYMRDSNREITLKYLHSLQNPIESLINEAKKYLTKNHDGKIHKIYGISQNPDTRDFILILNQISGNIKIDDFIQEMQLNINDTDIGFKWIPYNQFNEIKKIGEGGFSTIYSAIWKNGPSLNLENHNGNSSNKVALKCLKNSQNLSELLSEVKAYSTEAIDYNKGILKVYGISQDPDTNSYIIVLHYAKGGNFDNWININENYKYFDWENKIQTLCNIVNGLKEIHEKKMVHRDFHTGNILFDKPFIEDNNKIYISDMGLCGEVGNKDYTKIYGVMPYMAPEVLRGKPYTQAADIYSFGMIMYFVATGKQPFGSRAHDHNLVLDIYNGNRPEINEPEAPISYINIMKKCLDSKLENRPDIIELNELLWSITIRKSEIEEAENYRISQLPSIMEDRQKTSHQQAVYHLDYSIVLQNV
ncbi:hypothetical protein RclHR1_23630001 [Rhizophagus clarus]|uniref:Protein kinase domain-containing protein n=1 Tax=Rhizophagus clarus TaxID=94130 RepID=A0A2Z6R9J8_9GLOM|nr:hypothetical protein RclHR1_23630001 [Rhizophagus clarus]